MPIIDSDTHVIENELTWSYMQGSDEQYRPQILNRPDAASGSRRRNEFWYFDSQLVNKRSFGSGNPNDTSFTPRRIRGDAGPGGPASPHG